MIPKTTADYHQHPFDPSYTFTVNGLTGRYMATPLDEVYLHEPGDHVTMGSLPPEEMEVRDYITLASVLSSRLPFIQVLWSHLAKPTDAFRKCDEAFKTLDALACQSPEHRAAFLRLSRCKKVRKEIQNELKRMVGRADRRNGVVAA